MRRRTSAKLVSALAAVLLAGLWLSPGPAPVGAAVYLADSPAALEMLEQARELREQGRHTEAAAELQQLIERYPHRLMPTGDGRHEAGLRHVRQMLLDDPELLEAYRQLHAPSAQRQLRRAIDPRPVGGDLERLVARYGMTATGLEAGLYLAAYYLERADGRSAASVLDELAGHPDLADHAVRYHELQLIAGLLAGQRGRATAHRDALAALDADEALASVSGLARRLAPPYPLTSGAAGHLPELRPPPEAVDEPLWRAELEPSDTGTGSIRIQAGQARRTAPVQPVAGDRWLYINEGARVRAIDRSAGWSAWSYRFEPENDAEPENQQHVIFRRSLRTAPEPASVLVGRESVYAIVAEHDPTAGRLPVASEASNALVSLDRDTGAVRWQRQPEQLSASLRQGRFVEPLLAGSGRILALVRRSQNSGLADTFVAAIDAEDGSLLWLRHVASAATGARHEAAPPPRISQADGRLYVSDGIAVVSAIDERTGTVRWTRVFERQLEDLRRRGRVGLASSLTAAPLLVEAGLLVAALGEDADAAVTLLDPATGRDRELNAQQREAFAGARLLMPAGADVLVIGPTLRRVAGDDLAVRWDAEMPRQQRELTGNPALSRQRLALPVSGAILLVDMDTGGVAGRIGLNEPANLALLDGQVVAATADELLAYLSWERAYGDLRRQISAAPHDTAPGLALAELARRSGRGQAVLEGADHALAALVRPGAGPRDPQRQQHLFANLLALARDAGGLDNDTRQGLYDRVATVTAGPGQEVAYHLAVAHFHERAGRGRAAVDHLQSVLTEPALARHLYEQPLVSRQAGLEARRRLGRLVARLGPEVYEKYDRLARHRLDELTERPAPQADALIALAERYPEARVAPQARLIAADVLIDRQRDVEAARQLRLAYEQSWRRSDRAAAAGRLAQHHERQGRAELAIAWLRQVGQEHPDLAPHRDGQPLPLADWLVRLSEQPVSAAAGLAELELPLGSPRALAGRPIVRHDNAAAPGTDHLLLLDESKLHLHRAGGTEHAWAAELEMAQPRLLHGGDGHLVLFSPGEARLATLDVDTGEAIWPTIDVARAMEVAGDPAARDAVLHVGQRHFREMVDDRPLARPEPGPDGPALHAVAGTSTILLADAEGRLVGLDRASGQILWSRLGELDRVTAVASDGDSFAVAGVAGAETRAAVGTLLLLDESTGEPRALESPEPSRWVGFAGPGLVVTVAEREITAYRSRTGQVAWRVTASAAELTGEAWADDHLLIVRDADGRALVIEAGSGELVQRLTAVDGGQAGDFEALAAHGLWHIRTHEQALTLDSRGNRLWRDAIDLPETAHLVRQIVTRRHVVVLARQAGAAGATTWRRGGRGGNVIHVDQDGVAVQVRVEPGQRLELMGPGRGGDVDTVGPHRVYVLDRQSGSLLAEHVIDRLPQPLSLERAAAVDGALVLSFGERTVLLPTAGDDEADDEGG